MSVASRSGRARRGRVLVVSDVPGSDQLAAQLRVPPLIVRTLFDAIGEVTIASSSEPISTVVFSEPSLNGMHGRGVEALRKLDPSLQLVMVSTHAMTSAPHSSDGVDECLCAPLRPEDVARVFAGELVDLPPPQPPIESANAPALPPVDRNYDEGQPPAAPAIEPVSLDEPPSTQTGLDDDHLPEPARTEAVDVPLLESDPQPDLQPIADTAEQEAVLGDTDLVEAVLANQPVRELALRIMAQQTRWQDVRIEDQSESPRGAAAAVEILFAGDSYGWLISTSADEARLVPWADWLGRWLALERAYRQYRTLAYRDDLTAAWNRRYFNEFLGQTLASAARARRLVTVMVFDIDDFKRFNDDFGHEAGDEILRETVRLLTSVIRHGDRVCRIGGDEFAVIFADAEGPRKPGSSHPESVEIIARRFQDQVCAMRFPKLGKDAPGALSISGGLATFPWDGHDAVSLLRKADERALESKRGGKNAITFGPQESCGPRP